MTSVIRMLLRSRFISLPSSEQWVSLLLQFKTVPSSCAVFSCRCNCYCDCRQSDMGGHVLNFTPSVAFSLLVRGSIVEWTSKPLERASAGMSERNKRAGFERELKGLNATRTSVRNRVIMLAAVE